MEHIDTSRDAVRNALGDLMADRRRRLFGDDECGSGVPAPRKPSPPEISVSLGVPVYEPIPTLA